MNWRKIRNYLLGVKTLEKPDGTIIQAEKGDTSLEELQKKYGGNIIGYAPPSKNVKHVAGEKTNRPAHVILVKKKKPKKDLKPDEVVPSALNGVETDVIEIGEIKALGVTKRFRPLKCGPSIGNITITAGTPGGPAQFEEGTGWCTNSHVACESIRKDLSAQERKCVQPGKIDSGKYPEDYVGYVRKAYITPQGYAAYNDFAFILADKPDLFKEPLIYDMDLPWLEPVSSADMKPGDTLWKPITRTTNLSSAKVVSVGATVSVNYGNDGTITHKECLITGVMSAGGDSGSWCGKLVEGEAVRENLMRDVNRHPATYLFAGSNTTTIHHDLLSAMNGMSIKPYVPSGSQPPQNKIKIDFVLKKNSSEADYVVYGTVSDTEAVIKGCKMDMVNLDSSKTMSASTDYKGEYLFPTVPQGKYSLSATAEGYFPASKEFTAGSMQSFKLKSGRK